MNKQEVIDEIENAIPDFILNDYQRGKETGLSYALELVEELDEPEKPVVPQFVDTWIQGARYNGFDLYEAMTDDEMPVKVATWIANNPETFAKAWIYGYEVEKDKLYTVKFSNEDFGKFYIGIRRKTNTLEFSTLPLNDGKVKSWFTEDELKRLKFWDNPAFEIEEVEE